VSRDDEPGTDVAPDDGTDRPVEPDGGTTVEADADADANANATAEAGSGTDAGTEAGGGAGADAGEARPPGWQDVEEPANNRVDPEDRTSISVSQEKDDARSVVTGEAKYAADYRREVPDLAEAKVLRSEIAHGRVVDIDTSAAEEMDGVYAVITPDSDVVPDRMYTSAGQSFTEPSPWDMRVLRERVRYVGDPIAAVAAADADTADRAIRQIQVEYEEFDPVLDYRTATDPDKPAIHDPDEVENKQKGCDYERNVEAHAEGEIGDVEDAVAAAAARDDWHVHESEWEVPYQSHCVPEPHTTIVKRDQQHRYHVITATQVPFHTRRQLAHLFDVPIRDVRVSKPRIGAGFGAKQSMTIEPIVFALAEAAERPVIMETTRREQFYAMRFRRAGRIRMRSVVTDEGDFQALEMEALSNSGAYGPHGMTVTKCFGTKPLSLYPETPNIRFEFTAVHTNLPVAGAMRGYGAPQGMFALEGHVDEVAADLGLDPAEVRSRNHVREGVIDDAAGILDGGAFGRHIRSCGLGECIRRGKEAIGWDDVEQPDEQHRHRGVGMALSAQGSGVADDELGAAHIKMNEDGSFILQTGAVDTGPGADTVMCQIAAEILACDPADVVMKPSDTDNSPFDYGAYASSTTYVSGQAVKRAAEAAAARLVEWGAELLEEAEDRLTLSDGAVVSEVTGESVSFEEIGYESIYGDERREHVMGQASWSNGESPPPYAAQFVDVTVDEETGEYELNNMVMAVDCGVAINPALAEGQVEGGEHMALEYATSGDLEFDDEGQPKTLGFRQYGMPRPDDHPPMETILVETHEPTGPFGAKSIGEVPTNCVPPALSNAIYDAVGARVRTLPITPEKVQAALDDADEAGADGSTTGSAD
jgi:CO/xanthine dehydrogenase Mo-binding subunit